MNYAIIFPGQGSQSLGMLSDLSEHYPMIKEVFTQASDVLGFDLWHLTQTDANALNQTQNTQPAMLAAGFATYQVLQSQTNLNPTYLAGHSLGEYTALVAGGYLDFSTGIALVKKRAELMQSAVEVGKGAMAAVLGLEDDKVIALCASVNGGVVEAVNFNSPGQVVIAGDKQAVLSACELMKNNGAKRAVILPVSVPSHCSLMNQASQMFAHELNLVEITLGNIPIVHNVNADVSHHVDSIKQHLAHQLNHSVKWTQSVQTMRKNEVDTLLECGPGKVLSGLTRRIDKNIKGLSVFDFASINNAIQEINDEK